MLGACGGGSGGGVGSTPTPPPAPTPAPSPTPSPTPAPTPTPTPTPTALENPPPPVVIPQATSGTLKEALATEQGFVTGSLELDANYNTYWLTSNNQPYGSGTSLKLYVDPSTGTVTVYDTLGGGVPFGEGNEIGDAGYRSWGRNSLEAGRRLRFLNPEETTSDHPEFQLTYTSYGSYTVDSSLRGGNERLIDTFFYFGIPTAPDSLPRSGSASYQGIAAGKLYDFQAEYDLYGTATLVADFASGNIETEMWLKGYTPGREIDLGVFDGLAKITTGQNAFRGGWIASSAGFEGSILGAFFGPEAEEFGYTFGIHKPDLSAIGGGVVVGGQDPSVPPPPPPPPPAPPPPAPAGSTFPLASEETFETISATMVWTGSVGSGFVTAGAAGTEPLSDQRTVTVTPDYGNGTYTVRDGSVTSTFSLPDLFPAPDPDTRLVSLSDGGDDRLMLFNNLATGTGTNDAYLQLHYLSFAFLFENEPASGEHKTTALLFGTPTPVADLPRLGTATYTTQGFAFALTGYGSYADVHGELTADFASGNIENTFAIHNYRGASVMPLYRVSGSGSITSGSPFFSGSLTGSGNPLTGSYSGGFFGPSAEEAGFTFALTGTIDGAEQRIIGAAGGKR